VFGVPAVCPQIVVGNYSGRAGYIPGDRASMVAALTAAVAHGRFEGHKPQSWAAFTRRLLQGA
jgi:2-beta-glucuronyltransferase